MKKNPTNDFQGGIKMRLHREKYLLFFFSLLIICSQIVPAQDKNSGQISVGESNVPAPEIEHAGFSSSRLSPRVGVDQTDRWRLKKEENEFSATAEKHSETNYGSEIKDFKYNFRNIRVA